MAQFPDALTFFVRPSSLEELQRRLRGRGTESEEAIAMRLKRAADEIQLANHYGYQILNDDIDCAVAEIATILTQQWKDAVK